MKTFRIVNGFTEMIDAILLQRSNSIVNSMTGNAHFATPTPTLVAVTAAITAFQEAVQAAEGGDRQAILVRKAKRTELINLLHLLGNYVLFTAAGDEVVAASSGFTISKTAEPRPPIGTPQGLVLKNGRNRGELDIKCKRPPGVNSFVHEITPAPVTPDSVWQKNMVSTCRYLFTGLVSGQEYVCRIAAIGPKQQLVYSTEVSRVAL